MIQKLKRLLLSTKYKIKSHVVLGNSVVLDNKCTFEGYNYIGNNSTVYSSEIGYGTYIASDTHLSMAKIGRYSAIGREVRTFLGRHPVKDFVSINPAFYSPRSITGLSFPCGKIFEEHLFADTNKNFVVSIGNDVWIADRVVIMDGITVGDGAVIGLGSIVTKDIEPYSINVGSPAKKIRMRFTDTEIEYLLKFKWWSKNSAWINENKELFSNITNLMNTHPL